MILRVPAAFLTFLVSLIWAGPLCAQQRTPPVLRSGGTYSSNQADSQKDKNSGSTDIDEGKRRSGQHQFDHGSGRRHGPQRAINR